METSSEKRDWRQINGKARQSQPRFAGQGPFPGKIGLQSCVQPG
jgi:hypothetical protein